MKDVTQSIWTERYRPKKVDECILPIAIKQQMNSFIENGEIPHLLLSGSAGTGKTTVAKAICNEMDMDWMMINGSNEGRLIETFRTTVLQFASTVSFEGTRKCLIIDEADGLTDLAQDMLRNFIEEFQSNCVFILTCNFPNRLKDPIHSRCSFIDFAIATDERTKLTAKMLKRVCGILEVENIEYDKVAVAELCQKHFPDFRRTLNELQRYSSTGKIDSGIFSSSGISSSIDNLSKILKDKNFRYMREWVATTSNLEMSVLVRELYERIYEMVETDSIPQVVLTLADFSYKHSFVADKEVNIAAMLTTLMLECEFK